MRRSALILVDRRRGSLRRFEPLELELLVFQPEDQLFDRRDALAGFGFGGGTKFVVPITVEFRGALTEDPADAFAELKFGFSPRGILIGKSLLAEILDDGQEFLELGDPAGDFFDLNRFGP